MEAWRANDIAIDENIPSAAKAIFSAEQFRTPGRPPVVEVIARPSDGYDSVVRVFAPPIKEALQ